MSIRMVFFGSPEFALPTLDVIHQRYQIVGVITQPDRPAGRGKQLTPPPVKVRAKEYGIPVFQPNRLKDSGVIEQLYAWDADVYVVAAFGHIFRQNVLDIPKFGLINVHGSLLPRWRGAAPIQAAILAGDRSTGVTIMKIDAGIDTGDMLARLDTDIKPGETAGELSSRLAVLGAELLIDTLPGYLNGSILPVPQSNEGATYAGMINKEEALLDINHPAEVLHRHVMAFNPWPIARVEIDGVTILLHRTHIANINAGKPGLKLIFQHLPAISTGNGLLMLDELQLPGKKVINGKAFLAGNRNWGRII